jgi:hypothetical protein
MLDEPENDIVLWYLPFKVQEELYDIKGNEMDGVYVQREIEDTGIALFLEWAHILLEGFHVREHNAKHKNHVSHHGENEPFASDSDASDSDALCTLLQLSKS